MKKHSGEKFRIKCNVFMSTFKYLKHCSHICRALSIWLWMSVWLPVCLVLPIIKSNQVLGQPFHSYEDVDDALYSYLHMYLFQCLYFYLCFYCRCFWSPHNQTLLDTRSTFPLKNEDDDDKLKKVFCSKWDRVRMRMMKNSVETVACHVETYSVERDIWG